MFIPQLFLIFQAKTTRVAPDCSLPQPPAVPRRRSRDRPRGPPVARGPRGCGRWCPCLSKGDQDLKKTFLTLGSVGSYYVSHPEAGNNELERRYNFRSLHVCTSKEALENPQNDVSMVAVGHATFVTRLVLLNFKPHPNLSWVQQLKTYRSYSLHKQTAGSSQT